MAGFSDLPTLLTDAKREAMIADMTCHGWDYEGGNLKTKGWSYTNPYGGGAETWEVTISITGEIVDRGAAKDDIPERCATAVKQAIASWDTAIEDAAWGWGEWQVCNPQDFDDPIRSLEKAVQDLSANTGSANSKIGNPNLEAIGNIRDLFPAEGSRGETMATFYVKYGPNRVETVLDGHCEAVSCLYLALTGTKDIWTKARQDIADTFAASVTAFTGTRQNHPTEWKSALTVVTAAAGLAATWVTGPVGALVTGIAATGGFLGTVVGELQSGAGGATSNPYQGSTPQKVLEDLHAAMQALSDKIKAREQAIASMLDKMLGLVTDGGNRANFHVNATPGLDPTFAHGDDIIDMKFPVLREIGYTMMPQIASAFYDGSDAALAGKVTYPWSRLAWGLATEGAYPSWANLVNMVYPLMDDNGAELVKAGQHLAEAAGYLEAADQTGATALGQHAKEVEGAGLGWTKAHVDPPPAPPEPRHGGPQRVI